MVVCPRQAELIGSSLVVGWLEAGSLHMTWFITLSLFITNKLYSVYTAMTAAMYDPGDLLV